MQDLLIQQLLLIFGTRIANIEKRRDHPNVVLVIWFDTWKFESEEKEKSLAIDDFLEQHDSEDTADTPGGGGDEVDQCYPFLRKYHFME